VEKLSLNFIQMSPLKFGNVTAPYAKCMTMSTFLSITMTLISLKVINSLLSILLEPKQLSIYFVKIVG